MPCGLSCQWVQHPLTLETVAYFDDFESRLLLEALLDSFLEASFLEASFSLLFFEDFLSLFAFSARRIRRNMSRAAVVQSLHDEIWTVCWLSNLVNLAYCAI